LPDTVTLGRAYDGGRASAEGLNGHKIY